MKRIALLACAACVSMNLLAEGYQINTLSAKQEGMGHVGVAMKLGAESMFFNPAGLGFSNKTLDISGSISGIKATATCRMNGEKFTTDNGISTPISTFASFKVYNNLQAGVAFYTPYGSAINWGDNWPGAILNQKVNLKTYTVQPTLSWRITPKLSVGVGVTLNWGTVDLNKGLISGTALDAMLQGMGMPAMFGNTTPASVNLKGTADLAVGLNIGVMYDINSKVTVGAQWRSKSTMKVKRGDASVTYNTENEQIRNLLSSALSPINNTNFAAEMPMPQVFAFGVSYRPTDKWILAFDAQFTGWKTYKSLNIDFDLPTEQLNEKFDQNIEKNYHNSWTFKVGAQYALTHRFDVRAGIMFDNTPVDKNYYNPETPGMGKIEPSVGFSFQPLDRLSVDFSLMYVQGVGRNGTNITTKNFLTGQDVPIKADYRVHAFVPAIGISYGF